MYKVQKIFCISISALIVLTISVNLFYGLDNMDIVTFDEARHGLSAIEMIESGKYLINTYEGKTDYWNLKPPLAFAPMVSGFTVFGYNTFGLRIFSAIASALMLCIVFFTCYKNANYSVALIATAIIITSRTFISRHNARSGDADALFILLYITAICILIIQKDFPFRYAAACFLAALAFLTKSFHAGPLCLTIALFFFLDKGVSFRTIRSGCATSLYFFVPVFMWAILRYNYDGFMFLKLMVSTDTLDRLTDASGDGRKPLFFYLRFMISDLRVWLLVFAGCIIMTLPFWKRMDKPHVTMCIMGKLCIAIAIPLLLFSLSIQKLRWYTYPAYPLTAMFMAHAFGIFISQRKEFPRIAAIVCVAVVVAFGISEWRTLESIEARRKLFADPIQQQMVSVAQQHKNERITVFLALGEWQQAHVLLAKFMGNLVLYNGNKDAYERFAGKKQLILNKTTPVL